MTTQLNLQFFNTLQQFKRHVKESCQYDDVSSSEKAIVLVYKFVKAPYSTSHILNQSF